MFRRPIVRKQKPSPWVEKVLKMIECGKLVQVDTDASGRPVYKIVKELQDLL